MNEEEFTGSTAGFRKSEFIDSIEDLAGRTRANPVETTIEKAVICNNVVSIDGKKESDVLAIVITGAKRRLRINATKRKLLNTATGSNKAQRWKGLKIRVYVTAEKGPGQGAPKVSATAIDVWSVAANKWLRYFDFQNRKAREYIQQDSSLADNWKINQMPEKPAKTSEG